MRPQVADTSNADHVRYAVATCQLMSSTIGSVQRSLFVPRYGGRRMGGEVQPFYVRRRARDGRIIVLEVGGECDASRLDELNEALHESSSNDRRRWSSISRTRPSSTR